MNSRRRYRTFSLRTLFILVTALAVWLGVIVNRAREQREAVKAIEALGGTVTYDWQQDLNDPFGGPYGPGGPVWLRRAVGDDFFQDAVAVVLFHQGYFTFPLRDSAIRRIIPELKRLKSLKRVEIMECQTGSLVSDLEAALPKCEIVTFE